MPSFRLIFLPNISLALLIKVLTISKEWRQYQKKWGFIFKMNLHVTAIYSLIYSLATQQKQNNSFMVFMLSNTKGCVCTNNMFDNRYTVTMYYGSWCSSGCMKNDKFKNFNTIIILLQFSWDIKIPNKDIYLYRYSLMSFKIGDLKDVTIFTGKYLC